MWVSQAPKVCDSGNQEPGEPLFLHSLCEGATTLRGRWHACISGINGGGNGFAKPYFEERRVFVRGLGGLVKMMRQVS